MEKGLGQRQLLTFRISKILMKRNSILLSVLLLVPALALAQVSKDLDTVYHSVLATNLIQAKDIDSKQELDHYKEQLELSMKIIAYQNSLLSGQNQSITWQSQLITWLGIFIGIVSLAFPLFGYFYALLPTRKATNQLNERIHEQFKESQKLIKAEERKEAFRILKSLDESDERKQQAINYLGISSYDRFTENELLEIYQLLARNSINHNVRFSLIIHLSSTKNFFADKFFSEMDSNDRNIMWAVRYYVSKGYEDYRKEIINILENSSNFGIDRVISDINDNKGKDTLNRFMNDEELINGLSLKVLEETPLHNNPLLTSSHGIARSEYEQTYLAHRLEELIDE